MSAPRVLVLDDDPTIHQLLRTYFGGLGWSVQSCSDPAGAMDVADSDQPFDAVICDLHFTPGREAEGLQLIERARRRRPDAAVLLFTAADGPLRNEALARGADMVVSKPSSLTALRDAALHAMKKP